MDQPLAGPLCSTVFACRFLSTFFIARRCANVVSMQGLKYGTRYRDTDTMEGDQEVIMWSTKPYRFHRP